MPEDPSLREEEPTPAPEYEAPRVEALPPGDPAETEPGQAPVQNFS